MEERRLKQHEIIKNVCDILGTEYHHADLGITNTLRDKPVLAVVYPYRYGKASFWIYSDGTAGSDKRHAHSTMNSMNKEFNIEDIDGSTSVSLLKKFAAIDTYLQEVDAKSVLFEESFVVITAKHFT